MSVTDFYSTKTYGHERGFSCAFRQWKADSHCNLIHGYSLSFSFVFGGTDLDERNWVVDFGSLKPLEQWLRENFDHTMAVAKDDPMYGAFTDLHEVGLINMVPMKGVGCEMFALAAFNYAATLITETYGDRCWVESVEVREHGANSAIVKRKGLD